PTPTVRKRIRDSEVMVAVSVNRRGPESATRRGLSSLALGRPTAAFSRATGRRCSFPARPPNSAPLLTIRCSRSACGAAAAITSGGAHVGAIMPVNGKWERVEDQTIRLASGRPVGFADYGIPDATAVLWCHGGPGSRLEPAYLRRAAGQAGLRIIGIDRPGYGLSAPQPGRTIAGWVPEALAVADHLGIGQFAAVGVSTGGAYALAL